MKTATQKAHRNRAATASIVPSSWLFGSFFLGGFECSTHRTPEGHRLDLVAATQHDVRAREDYALCRSAGIHAVREAVRWPLADQGGRIDLGPVRQLARLGEELGRVQIWDLMHYGYPDDLCPWRAEEFIERFAAYAGTVARAIREHSDAPGWYTPVNEISYYAWAGGDVGYMAPFGRGRGGELKRVLVRAAIAAADANWAVDPAARILTVDPLVHQYAPPGRPDLAPQADHFNRRVVTEAFDLLAGRLEPELGGSRRHLGVIGLNYYACNQWTIPTPEQPQRFLTPDDAEWVALSDLLADLQQRYGGPLILAETGASGEARPAWIEHLAAEAEQARVWGVNLQGACLIPSSPCRTGKIRPLSSMVGSGTCSQSRTAVCAGYSRRMSHGRCGAHSEFWTRLAYWKRRCRMNRRPVATAPV